MLQRPPVSLPLSQGPSPSAGRVFRKSSWWQRQPAPSPAHHTVHAPRASAPEAFWAALAGISFLSHKNLEAKCWGHCCVLSAALGSPQTQTSALLPAVRLCVSPGVSRLAGAPVGSSLQ